MEAAPLRRAERRTYMIFPGFPTEGDTIGICAPSAGVGHKIESFDKSLDAIRQKGFLIGETACVRTDSDRSGTAEERGREFSQLMSDDDIKAVISASGGDYALEMLPYVDWEAVSSHPKWVTGASDPTNILYVLTTKYDIATIYGFNAGTFDWDPLHRFQENALSIFTGDIVEQTSFDKFDPSREFTDEEPQLTADVFWKLFMPDGSGGFSEGGRLDVSGRLIGGCIDCISRLIGTPYDGTPGFVEKYDGLIWYFDNFALSKDDLYAVMLQMKYCGYFRGTKAVIFGRTMFTENTDEEYTELLSRVLDVPFIWNADIGHVKPCMTLINGALADVGCAGGRGYIKMRLG